MHFAKLRQNLDDIYDVHLKKATTMHREYVMRGATAIKRRERQLRRVMDAINRGTSYRDAENKFHILKSNAWDRLHASPRDPTRPTRTAPTRSEEQLIVDLILRFNDRKVPSQRLHVQEAGEIIISEMSVKRQEQLP